MRSLSTLKRKRNRPHCKLAAAIEKGMYAKAAVMAMTGGKSSRTQSRCMSQAEDLAAPNARVILVDLEDHLRTNIQNHTIFHNIGHGHVELATALGSFGEHCLDF